MMKTTKVTRSQIFQIGTAILGFLTLVVPLLLPGLDKGVVTTIGGAAATLWGTIGTILTTPQQQLNAVVGSASEPTVQKALTTAVAQYPGVESIQTNQHASETLKSLAKDQTNNILPPP
jgi:hypothetical protein